MKKLLLILNAFMYASISIKANQLQGDITANNIILSGVVAESKAWHIEADLAKSIKDCLIISGNVIILAKKNHTQYKSNSFKLCPKTGLLSSLAPVIITQNNLTIKANILRLNLKTNISTMQGVTAVDSR